MQFDFAFIQKLSLFVYNSIKQINDSTNQQ